MLNLNSGSYLISSGSSFVTNNSLNLSGSTVDIEAALALDTLTLSSGTLNIDTLGGGTDLTINTALNWNGSATINGGGTGGLVNLGSVIQSGSGQTFTMNNLAVNNQGSWLVDGTVNNAIRLNSGTQFLNAGSFTMNSTAGLNDTNGGSTEKFDNTGVFTLNSGANTIISNLAFNNTGVIDIAAGGGLSLNGLTLTLGGGTLKGNGTFIGNIIADAGSTIAAGLSPGTLSVTGDVLFESGSNFDVELETTSLFDALVASGDITVDGANLNVVGFNGYLGNISNSFQILTAGGTFTSLADFIVSNDLNFTVTPNYTQGAAGKLILDVTGLNNFWVGSDTLWEASANWSRGIVPNIDHDIFIDDRSSTVIYSAGVTTVSSLQVSSGNILQLTGGSLEVTNDSLLIDGLMTLDAATLILNGNTTMDTLLMSNASVLDGSGSVDVLTSLVMNGSDIQNLADVAATQYTVTGTSRFINTVVNHDGVLEITGAGDRLRLDATKMISTDGGSSSATVIGAGTLDLLPGSDWVIDTALPVLMPASMKLDLNGGLVTNVEKLGFPGIVNANLVNFVENGSILIPSTTTFNFFDNNNFLPAFGVVNDGTFIIQNNLASMSLNVQDGSAFINNGTFQVNSASTLSLLSNFVNNNLLSINSAGSTVVVESGVTLTQAGSITGNGVLSMNGGVMEVTAVTSLPDTLLFNLVSGSLLTTQNLSAAGQFEWVSGTVSGAGLLTTSSIANVQNGVLDTTWNANGATTVTGVLSGTGGVGIRSAASLTASNELAVSVVLNGGTLTANNLLISNSLNWLSGTVNGTGLTTSALATVQTTVQTTVLDSLWAANGTTNVNGSVTGTGGIEIPVDAVFTGNSNLISTNVRLSGGTLVANTLELSNGFDWTAGTVDGTQLTTSGQVTLTAGSLLADWLIASGSVVNWGGVDTDSLVITNATITNQGLFRVGGSILTDTTLLEGRALKNFGLSSGATFINQGTLLINGLDPVVFDLTFDNDGGLIGINSGSSFSLGVSTPLILDQATDRLQGFGTFVGNVSNVAGVVTPGSSVGTFDEIGTLTVNGNYSQGPAGTLVVKLDSVQGSLQNDALNVAGQLVAGGTIDFKIVDASDFKIKEIAGLLDQSFKPLTFGTYAGKFAEASIPLGLNFTLGEGGVINITLDQTLVSVVSNQIEDLFRRDDLKYDEVVKALEFVKTRAVVAVNGEGEDEDEDKKKKRAPKLVCK